MFLCNNEGIFQKNICVCPFKTIISIKRLRGNLFICHFKKLWAINGNHQQSHPLKTWDLVWVILGEILLNYLALDMRIKPSEGKRDNKNAPVP